MTTSLVPGSLWRVHPRRILIPCGHGHGDERDDVFLRVFDAYARVMGWASASSRPDSRALWNLRNAELASRETG